MSAGRILLLIFGILILLGSVPLLFGGGVLLWVDLALMVDDGFMTTSTYQLERDSYAIVTEPADIDFDEEWNWGWGWHRAWNLGDLVTFKVEGRNKDPDPSKGIFIGIAEELNWEAYLSDVEYDVITDISLDPFEVVYMNNPGSSVPAAPTSQTFWTANTSGTGTQTLEWQLEKGRYSLVLMNQDGSQGVDLEIALGVKIPLIFGVGVGMVVGGIVALVVGIIMIIFAVRGRKRLQPSQPMHIISEV